jgi:hypothetical protein
MKNADSANQCNYTQESLERGIKVNGFSGKFN